MFSLSCGDADFNMMVKFITELSIMFLTKNRSWEQNIQLPRLLSIRLL